MEVVTWSIKIGGHCRNPAPTKLTPRCLDLHDARNFRNRVGVVCFFQCAGHQRRFTNRLLGKLGINARRPQKQQPLDTHLVGSIHQVCLYLQVLAEEVSRVGVVGMNSADFGRRINHHIGADVAQGPKHRRSVGQIHFTGGETHEVCIALLLQSPPNCRAGQSPVARHINCV